MTVGATTGVGTTPATNPVNEDFKIKDYTFLKSDLEEMQEIMNSGDLSQAIEKRDEMAATIMGIYSQNGASISEDEALALVDLNYESIKEQLISEQNAAEAEEFEIKDYGFLASDLEVMYGRLSSNDQKEALDMRKEMAQQIMQIYQENGSSISEKEALGLVDLNYRSMSCTGGASVVETIQATTKDANSILNYIPVVSWFVDNTSAEELYDYMEDGKTSAGDKFLNSAGKVLGQTGTAVAAGAAIGSVVPVIGTTAGALVGLVVGLVSGAIDVIID